MTLAAVNLDDKYALESGRVYLTGTQALVRLPMMQRQRDLAQGLNTAGFVTGYRGSPLGAFDQTLWRNKDILKQHHVHFEPGINACISRPRASGMAASCSPQTIWIGMSISPTARTSSGKVWKNCLCRI